MTSSPGLRERKKQQQRERLADVAATLFAEHGYDDVSMGDVARAADVSDQTVYNYFPAKPDLVLDRAEEIRGQYAQAIREREPGSSPAATIRVLVRADVDRFRGTDLRLAQGELPALCVQSAVLRRFALEMRERQVDTVADEILKEGSTIHPLVVRAHAAALIWVVQAATDRIGERVLAADTSDASADAIQRDADEAFDDLDRHFAGLAAPSATADPTQGERP